MSPFNTRGLIFAANCTVAALAALLIGSALDMPNPGWAALTVFIVSQPMAAISGAVTARAVYRLLGSLGGGAMALLMIPGLSSTPELLVLFLGAWIMLCMYLSLLRRGPESYAYMLAGYTVALVGLPLAAAPAQTFQVMVLRAEQVAIGAACAAVMHSLVLPRSMATLAGGKLRGILADTKSWIAGALGETTAEEQAARRRLAQDLGELHLLGTHLRFDLAAPARSMGQFRAVEERLAGMLPLVAAVDDRLAALRALGALPPQLLDHVGQVRDWLQQPVPASTPQAEGASTTRALQAKGRDLVGQASWADPWQEALAHSLVERLDELLHKWDEVQGLSSRILAGDGPGAAMSAPVRALHRDHTMAAFAGFGVAVSAVLACLLVIGTGWPQGVLAVGVAATVSSVLAFLDDPRPLQRLLVNWSVISIPVAALYVFALLPLVSDVAGLVLVLTPLYFLTALYLASPAHWLKALGFALVTQTLISLQPAHRPDLYGFLAISISGVVGGVIALFTTSLIRVVSVQTSSWRIVHSGWRELLALTQGRGPDRAAWVSKMLDRVAMLAPRLPRARLVDTRLATVDALVDLRIGVNLLALRELDAGSAQPAIARVLADMAHHLRARLRRQAPSDAPQTSLLQSIDEAIHALAALPNGSARSLGLAAVAGLRRNLFPATTSFPGAPSTS